MRVTAQSSRHPAGSTRTWLVLVCTIPSSQSQNVFHPLSAFNAKQTPGKMPEGRFFPHAPPSTAILARMQPGE